MKRSIWFAAGLAALLGAGVAAGRVFATPAEEKKAEMQVVHDVFFELNESSPANRVKLVDLCKKFLSKHEGSVFFAVGTVAEKLDRDVNVRDWDVGLHIVFKDMAAHDKYQTHERHLKFIEEGKALWKKVRVFDTQAEAMAD